MKYLNESDIAAIGIDWDRIIKLVQDGARILMEKDYAQPLKPYLRYRDVRNRIIAMPAFVGGSIEAAGIKWIASFPGNIQNKIPRAHSVIILNEHNTGIPIAVINTALVSGIRTAGVSGLVIDKYLQECDHSGKKFNAGIIGFGPIGRLHLKMLIERFGKHLGDVYLYDIKGIDEASTGPYRDDHHVIIADNWEEVYNNSDIFITCTVSQNRYINLLPLKGKLYLNVSLRDFDASFIMNADVVVVDDWEEVCRENTDIECAFKQYGLQQSDVLNIADILNDKRICYSPDTSVIFNPMGMAIFDMTVAKYYYDRAVERNVGLELN